ncbi:hypothetical protein [Duganella rhizosphaerae]|uniref:hypothetical protein n=1 Tax=Duganella rhizosphaerae TaxID=2885763 RepID=UPI00403F93BA
MEKLLGDGMSSVGFKQFERYTTGLLAAMGAGGEDSPFKMIVRTGDRWFSFACTLGQASKAFTHPGPDTAAAKSTHSV